MADNSSPLNRSWTVGSARACDLVVAQPFVSGQHCRLSAQNDEFVLEDLGSSNGTFVNGYRLETGVPVFVTRGDQITLGNTLPMPWPSMPGDEYAQPESKRSASPDEFMIGRAPECEIRLDYQMISWHHARITRNGAGWTIEDLNSTNGTALNQIDNKIQRAALQPTDEIFLGSYKIAASKILKEKRFTGGENAFEVVRFKGDRMVLGRDPAADQHLDYPMISWQHAALTRSAEGLLVEDLGSRNGTYVDGARISGKVLVRAGQEIGLGTYRFKLLEDGALAKREYVGNVTIEVNSVAVDAPNGDRLLDSVSLTVFPSELVALMGPAGAGKTTFLKAINGYTPPAGGNVLFNGADLYEYYDRFRQQMSYVPQDDIVHAQLTVREALYFSAKLRTDLKDSEIELRIDKVLNSLGIQDKKNTIIGSPERKVLSGGQRKRVNIAMELIADAPVIFLDEPTSGLSSYDAENVVQVLKKLATDGTTIITTIHQPSLDIFKMFDSLIMISRDRGGRGALAYFGPAYPDSIEFFDAEGTKAVRSQQGKELSPEMLLSGLAKNPTAEWVASYEKSRYKKLFVTDRSGKVPSTPKQTGEGAVRKIGLGQWWTLVRRNYLLKVRDRAQGVILLVQAPLFGLLLGLVFGRLRLTSPEKWPDLMKHAIGMQFLMVVAAIWFGCNNVARDIVGEWTVFQRERMVSLKLPSYVFSKLTIAAVLSLFQCLALLSIVTVMCGLQADFLSTLGILYLASMVGAALGLCVSARTSTTEAAIAMLPLILLPIIALGGGLSPTSQMTVPMRTASAIVPSRWAFEANMLLEAKEKHADTDATRSDGSKSLNDTNDPEKLHCDLAEAQYPREKPAAADQSCRVLPIPPPDAERGRTALRDSFVVLGSMFVFWVGVALIFLKMRDIQ